MQAWLQHACSGAMSFSMHRVTLQYKCARGLAERDGGVVGPQHAVAPHAQAPLAASIDQQAVLQRPLLLGGASARAPACSHLPASVHILIVAATPRSQECTGAPCCM